MGTLDSAVGSGSLAESTSLNVEFQSTDASNATVSVFLFFKKTAHPLLCFNYPLLLFLASVKYQLGTNFKF